MRAGCSSCGSTLEAEDASFWIRLGVALVLAGQSMVFGLAINLSSPEFASSSYYWLHGALIASALVSIALLGPRLARESWRALRAGRITVEALFVVSCAGALAGSLIATFTGVGAVYYEVVAIVLAVYSVGKRIGRVSRGRVLREIESYREMFDRARVMGENGTETLMPAAAVPRGASVRIDPGEPVSVDGIVSGGEGYIEQSQLTGEPVPVVLRPGSEIHAGSWSVDGTFTVEATTGPGERRIDGILAWVEEARERPSRLEAWADRTIGWFFPFVVTAAVLVFAGWFAAGAGWAEALFNAMAVLLVACPCALGLATPIAVWKGMFRLAESGFLCRHGSAFDALARTRRIFFDKTGTLSDARLVVRDFETLPQCSVAGHELRRWVAAVETGQDHPVARALALIADPGETVVTDRRIRPGKGIAATIRLPDRTARVMIGPEDSHITVHLDDEPVARARIEEVLRGDAEECLAGLRDRGIAVEILSGDPRPAWEQIGDVSVEGSLSPEEKAQRVRASVGRGEEPLFVGDGINDTPAMATGAASVSIADGAALPRATADAILTSNHLRRIPGAIDLARRVYHGVRGNIRFAVVYNIAGITLAAAGILHPVVAALLMLASSATVSIRALHSAEFPQ